MTDNALSLLGLALRGNNLAVGGAPVEEACKTRRAKLVLTAADAAENSAQRARRWAQGGNVPWAQAPWDKETLGRTLGRSTCAMAALTDVGLAAALVRKLPDIDPAYRSLAENWVGTTPHQTQSMKKKNVRAKAKRPAVPET